MNTKRYRKAIAALLTPLVVLLITKVGLDASDEVVIPLVTILTGLIVREIPNERAYG
jgi:hypothetical protein